MSKLLKWVEIDKSNLLHNVREFRRIVTTSLTMRDQEGFNIPSSLLSREKVRLFAVVKANAYGHGIVEIADVIKDEVYGFAVNYIDEALALRKAGIKNPILTLGYTLSDRLQEAVRNNITLCVYNKETIERLGEILKNKEWIPDQVGNDTKGFLKQKNNFCFCKEVNPLSSPHIKMAGIKARVHIKVDTGLSRQGIFPDEVVDFVRFIQKFENIEIEGIYSHFANIEDTTDHFYAEKQLKTFESVLSKLEKNNIDIPIKHTACTAAAILFPQTYFNAVRVGIGIYGLWSSNETKISATNSDRLDLVLKPVMTWKTRVAQVKWIPANTPVGYGLTFFTARKTKIAVLPVGYSDGYDRKLSNNSYVVINNKRCPVLGRIMMNTMVVDVTEVENVEPEDEVILLGNGGMSAEEMASKIGSINYEVVTRVNPETERVVV